MTLDIEALKELATHAKGLWDSQPNLFSVNYYKEQTRPEAVLELIAEIERLQAQIEAVKELHSPFLFGKCTVCSTELPCRTLKALGVRYE